VKWTNSALEAGAFFRVCMWMEAAPEAPAVIDLSGTYTYKQLVRRASAIAQALMSSEQAPTPERPLALYLPPGFDMIAAMLAALKLGVPYVPLDVNFPRERNMAILNHAQCALVVCAEELQSRDYRNDLSVVCPLFSLGDVTAREVADNSEIGVLGGADSNAYILYTSGSTGNPKGVFQNQRGLLHDVMQYSQAIDISAQDCLSGFYSPSVNGAIRDIWAALFNGASVVAISPLAVGLQGMAEWADRYGVTIFHAIPPLLRAFLHAKPSPKKLASVRLCYIAGDKFFSADVQSLFQTFPDSCQIYTGIGSTECATIYRHWILDKNTQLTTPVLPLGHAVEDRETRLLGENSEPVKPGEQGQVEVCSPYLARGYWREPELTAAHFVPDNTRPRWVRFKPGDMLRELPSVGDSSPLYEYVGRVDAQVKIRGFRLDLALMEASLRQWMITEQLASDIAVLILGPEHSPHVREPLLILLTTGFPEVSLRTFVERELGSSYQPHYCVVCDTLPRLANFKLDAQAARTLALAQLPAPDREKVSVSGELLKQFQSTHKLTDAQITTVRLWCETFGVPLSAGVLAQYWKHVGADSLRIMNFICALDNALGIRFPNELVGGLRGLGDLLAVLEREWHGLLTEHKHDCTLVIVPPFVGLAGLPAFDERIDSHIRLIKVPTDAIFRPIGDMQPDLREVVNDLVDYLVPQLDSGPLFIYGISSGSKPAFFAACELQKRGTPVSGLMLGDADPLGRAEHFGAERLRAFSWLTADIPHFNGHVVEVIAMKQRLQSEASSHWKAYRPLGWGDYSDSVEYLPVKADHVQCLHSSTVTEFLNVRLNSGRGFGAEPFVSAHSDAQSAKHYALRCLMEGDPAKAVCWFHHAFKLEPWLEHIYQFNLELAERRARED